jgi:hypothetical protein
MRGPRTTDDPGPAAARRSRATLLDRSFEGGSVDGHATCHTSDNTRDEETRDDGNQRAREREGQSRVVIKGHDLTVDWCWPNLANTCTCLVLGWANT